MQCSGGIEGVYFEREWEPGEGGRDIGREEGWELQFLKKRECSGVEGSREFISRGSLFREEVDGSREGFLRKQRDRRSAFQEGAE